MAQNIIGYYGKIPSHGDFVKHNLPRCFTETWDQWLQECLVHWRQSFQGDWMVNYLTMPVQRFILSAGIAGEVNWYGVLLPSRDKAGRLFPFTVCIPIPSTSENPIQLYGSNQAWLDKLEEAAISCLMPSFTKENLNGEFQDKLKALSAQLPTGFHTSEFTQAKVDNLPHQAQFAWHGQASDPSTLWKKLLNITCQEYMHAYSIWWTKDGHDLMFCQGLPALERTPALIDQQWKRWGWLTDPTTRGEPPTASPPTKPEDSGDDTRTF